MTATDGWIERVFGRLAAAAIARPRRTLVAVAAAVAVAAPGLLRLELRTDGQALVPRADPAIARDAEVREHFGLRDPIVVLLETSHPDGIFNPGTLRSVQAVSDELAALPGIGERHVMSLATERRDRVYPGTLVFRPFLDPPPETPELLDQLRSDVEAAAPLLEGTLVTADRRATAILVGAPPVTDGGAWDDRATLHRRIAEIVAPYESASDRFVVAGAPVAESLLGRHILEDLRLLVPLAMAVIALVLWLGCRRVWGVALGLAEVGACLVFTFGVMGWLGVPIYLPTAVLPVILTTIGLADEIHVFWHYQRLLATGDAGPHPHPVAATLREMTRPVVLTSLTTSLGFLSFLASPIAPVRAFGVFAALGILFCMVFTLTAVPAALARIPGAKLRRPAASGMPGERLARLARPLFERRRAVVAGLGLVTLALAAGAGRLVVQDSWIDGFAPASPLRRAVDRVNERLYGSHQLLVDLTYEPPPEEVPRLPRRTGPLLDPRLVELTGDFEEFVRRRPEVGGVLGPHRHLSTVHYLWLARRDGARSIPDDPRRMETLYRRFDQGRGVERRREVIDDDLRRAVVSIFLRDANYRETAELIAAIRDYEARHLAPRGVRVGFAGDVAVSQAMIPAIVETQVVSLVLALAGALAATTLLYRSLGTGLAVVMPAAVAVAWAFGAMGWLGIPLGVATSMFCAITLGIGVDYGIHFTERFRRARATADPFPALAAVRQAGPAILADALAIGLGFGLLAVSQVPANARLGLIVAFALASASLLTLVGLGALVASSSESADPELGDGTGR